MSKLERSRRALEAIEERGYSVRGLHDDIGGKSSLILTATHKETGNAYRLECSHDDEYNGLIELAARLGFQLEQ